MKAPIILQTPRCQSTAGQPSSTRSPLRYVGGKSKIAKVLASYLPTIPSTLFSPFLGGASVELLAAALGWRVAGTDASSDVVAFWRVLLSEPAALADAVEQHYPPARDDFDALQHQKFTNDFDRAVGLFVCNRSSFGGATYSGGFCEGRFTRNSIDRLRTFSAPNLTVKSHQDFRVSIPRHAGSVLFLDPPYPTTACNLYGRNGDLHRHFDHQALRELLHGREGWMLCYPDTAQIRQWYRHATIIPLSWAWGIGVVKCGREVLILSADLAALVQNSTR